MANYKIKCSSIKPIKVDEIQNSENLTNFRFPQEYKNFVLENNGGTVNFEDADGNLILAHIEVNSWGQSTVTFISHEFDEVCKISYFESYYNNSREIFPKEVVPFAMDAAGNYFVFNFNDNLSEPTIYFQDHEETTSEDELDDEMLKSKSIGEYQIDGLELVANTFSEFLSKIKPDSI